MSLKNQGKNNKSSSVMDNPRHSSDYPTRDELVSQLAQLRSSLDGAYETLDSIAPSTDPDVTHKVADMVDIINGLHECEFELMDLLSKDGHVISPSPNRVDNTNEKSDEKCDGTMPSNVGDGDSRSRNGSQEDLSVYGAYALSSSRAHRNANELSKTEKSDRAQAQAMDSASQITTQDRLDYIRRLEEIQKVNEKLVDRCRRLGLVLSRGLDKNISSKMKEVKDIVATKEQAQRKILELKALMQQVTDDKLGTDISLAKIENDESYGRAFRFESRLTSRGASSISPEDHVHGNREEEENIIKKPRSLLGVVDSSSGGPDYAQFLRGPRQSFNRDHGERESAFVPIHNVAHLDPTRDKNNCSSNVDHNQADLNNEIKAPRVTGGGSLLRRVIDGGNPYPANVSQLDAQRQARSSSARATLVPPQGAAGCNTLPNNLFRSNFSKSPPSMQSSSGMGSMNSRSMASLENCRNEVPYISMPRIASRNQDSDDNVVPRGFSDRTNLSSNNLNKSYRQPTRSSSFYSELDFRNQEVFPTVSWEEESLHTHTSPIRRTPPEFRRRMISTVESQQITDELNRFLRCRNPDDSQNWYGSTCGSELGPTDRHSYIPEQNFMQRAKSTTERTTSDCYSQIMQLHQVAQEITQQVRNLTVSVAANKAATREALMQHRFDLHNVSRCIRDVSDLVSDSMKRMETQMSSQTRLIMDMESRLRRLEDNQRTGDNQRVKYESSRDREWQAPGRPDFMVSQDMSFQYSRDAMRERERENGSGSMLNNQMPPGTRANNYWDNFRSYSRQNMLSKSNANVPQQFSHEASPSGTTSDTARYTSSDALNNSQSISGTSDISAETRLEEVSLSCSNYYSKRNGSGKNLWATSGFYENMSTKKRNKDQKAQSSTIPSFGKTAGNVASNSGSVAEPLRSSRDSHPEPDENSSTPVNRPPLYSRMSPLISPYRRDPEYVPFSRLSEYELPWPHSSTETGGRKHKYDSEKQSSSKTVLQPLEITNPPEAQLQHHRERDIRARLHDISPGSKAAREQRILNFERSAESVLSNLEDPRATNQELLGGTSEDTDWVVNALDAVTAVGIDYHRSPLVSPIIPLSVLDNNENGAPEHSEPSDMRGRSSIPNVLPSTPDVSMNIRCEENVIAGENAVDRNGSRSSESTSNNNI